MQRRGLALEGAVHDGGLEAGAVKGEKTKIGAAQFAIGRRCQAGLGIKVGEIQEDRDLLGDDLAAMHDRRELAHRVDGQEGGLALFAGSHVEDFEGEGDAEFLEQRQGPGGAGLRRVIERDQIGHGDPVVFGCWPIR